MQGTRRGGRRPTLRMLGSAMKSITTRSIPMPPPACGNAPYLEMGIGPGWLLQQLITGWRERRGRREGGSLWWLGGRREDAEWRGGARRSREVAWGLRWGYRAPQYTARCWLGSMRRAVRRTSVGPTHLKESMYDWIKPVSTSLAAAFSIRSSGSWIRWAPEMAERWWEMVGEMMGRRWGDGTGCRLSAVGCLV